MWGSCGAATSKTVLRWSLGGRSWGKTPKKICIGLFTSEGQLNGLK